MPFACVPITTALTAEALLDSPIAIALMAEDWLSLPIAIELSDKALALEPYANASLPEDS